MPTYDAPGAGYALGGGRDIAERRSRPYSTPDRDTATAIGFGGSPPSKLRLPKFRPIVKGALRGFAGVELPNGLTIADCPICVSHGRAWASLPSKPIVGSDGTTLRGDAGKIKYSPILRWRSRELSDRFSAAVVGLIRSAHPDALDGGAA